jgi:hypothetical protein
MRASDREMAELELALLRRGVHDLLAGRECCDRCRRSPLIGERVYAYDSGVIVCELCRTLEHREPTASRIVHGPEFGHTMRIRDNRNRLPGRGPDHRLDDHRPAA